MRFLANENFPFPSIIILRGKGYEVISVTEVMSSAKDEVILQKAMEEQLIILTFDKDYGELLFKYFYLYPPGVVVFRLENFFPEDVAKILLSRVENDRLELDSYFTIIENDKTRKRKLR